uniref:Uncharacterized protein n=1 Tax=Populus trichocarpa TaxID=3694 RepID=A0A2K1YMM3_POPTR
MKMSRILRVIQIIVNFFVWICSFRPYFIRNNVVLKAYCFLQCPDEEENKEQMSKSLLNRFVAKCIALYFNPAEPCEELSSIVPRVCRPRCSEKSGEKEISGKLDSNMVEEEAIRINGMSNVCDLGGRVSMFGIKFLLPFICSTVKVYLENH